MQMPLNIPVNFSKDAYDYGHRSDGENHGLVLTKPHVVDLILDLAGYRADGDLAPRRILEPSCGHGAFLVPVVERLMTSAKANGVEPEKLRDAVAAFDIEQTHVDLSRRAAVETLLRHDVAPAAAKALAEHWVRQGDFLLAPLRDGFDFVVGNPPYIRIEQLSPEIQSEYRRRYVTLFDRADLYIAFIERSLRLLGPGGVLSFVCADRWTLNRYGAPLRSLIATEFAVRTYVDLHRASPFESEVIAYPSIFAIAREPQENAVRVVTLDTASPEECEAIRQYDVDRNASHEGVGISEYTTWFTDDEPWVLSSPTQLATLRKLEERFPMLEESGRSTSVRIGVATGNDRIYIVPVQADIEPDRLVPLVMRDDCRNGKIQDAGRRVINTFEEKGTVDLSNYPRLNRYFETHSTAIRNRHVAKKNAASWFRTIDRVYPELVRKPKLLIPDIAGSNEIIYDEGRFYPHHNLYFVVSEDWDLEVLGGLLSSRVALFFVWSYAVKMRGGYLRFQAQYLRRIRVPSPDAIPSPLQAEIKKAFQRRDFPALDELARRAYGLDCLPEFEFVDARK